MTTVRNSRARNNTAAVMVLLIAGIAGPRVSAHRLDEYLQAARLDLDAGHAGLELTMTPGIAVAEAIIADIDRDHDGSLSPLERQAYATSVLSALDFEVDGRRLQLQSVASRFPDLDGMRRGEGAIVLHSDVLIPPQSRGTGAHRVFFRNTYRRDVSVYLANAVVPASDRLAINAQRRDHEQRELTIDYVVQAGPARSGGVWLLIGIAAISLTSRLLAQRSRPPVTGL